MNNYSELLADYEVGVRFSQVSGFEILELLDTRSRLALAESQRKEISQNVSNVRDRFHSPPGLGFVDQFLKMNGIWAHQLE